MPPSPSTPPDPVAFDEPLEDFRIDDEGGDFKWVRSEVKIILLASPFLAAQVVWLAQQAFGVPYLLSIGFTNSNVTLTLLAGPLAGFFLPPIIAVTSDGSRRRQILGGGLGVLLSFPCLAFARGISAIILSLFSVNATSAAVATVGKLIAVAAVYALNASMQPLNIGLRALLMDVCQPHQQAAASLWVTRLSAIGSVLGTATAYLSSPSFQLLSVVCCVALGLLLGIHSLEARKYYARQDQQHTGKAEQWTFRSVARKMVRLAFKSRSLPPVTRRVCRAQLLSWAAWFPLLFYMTSTVSDSYIRAATRHGRPDGLDSEAKVASAGAILGFHTVVLFMTMLLEAFVRRPAPSLSYSDAAFPAYEQQLFKAWALALATAAASFIAAPLLYDVDNAVPLVMVSLGVQFAICNWVPYGLLGLDLANVGQRIKSGRLEPVRGREDLDEAAAILAIHNCAICVAQIGSAILCGVFFGAIEVLEIKTDLSVIFLVAAPFLLIAAYNCQTWRRR